MSQTKGLPKRGKEVLTLVRDHGPVTIDMLSRMTQPPMQKTNLRFSLAVLRRKMLIERLSHDSQTAYYQISPALPNRKAVANILGEATDDSTVRFLRRQDRFHNQWCEYWALSIKRLYPEAEIIREHSFASSEKSRNILQVRQNDFDILPDFLLSLPKGVFANSVHIAFEIERSRKSNDRLIRKFMKYLDGTMIDGLIYICETGNLSETLRELYQTKLVFKSPRIKHYGEHFFMLSDCLDGGGSGLDRFFNASGKPISFANWCQLLRSTKHTLRRDQNFKIYDPSKI